MSEDRLDTHLKLAPSSRDLAQRVTTLEAKVIALEQHLANANAHLGTQVARKVTAGKGGTLARY